MTDRLSKLQQLHDADPADTDLSYMIALEHAKAGDHDAAIQWLDKTLAQDPHYHYAYYQKARTYAAMNRHDEAKRVIETGLDRANAKGDVKAASELAGLLDSLAG